MTSPRAPFPSGGWTVALASIGAIGVVVLCVLAALVAVPPSLANLDARLADGEPVPLAGSAASVAVPEGWVVIGEGSETLTARTPDGALSVELRASELDADAALEEAVAEIRDRVDGRRGPLRREALAPGTAAAHCDVGARGVAAAVGEGPVVTAVAVTADDTDMADYRRALAELLDGVRP
jgi:hypothetical protein